MLTPYDARVVQTTLEAITRRPGALARSFDDRLNQADPTLCLILSAFRFDKSERFVDVLVAAIAHADEPDELGRTVRILAQRQGEYVWQPRRQAIVGHALIAALAETLGDAFTEDARQAWTSGYVALAEAMLRATCNRLDLVA